MPDTNDVISLPILTRQQLLDANMEAISNDYSAYCWQDTLELMLYEGNRHPVTAATLDPDGNLVCRVLVSVEEVIFIALTKTRFNALGTVPIDLTVLEAMAEAAQSSIN
jgi:hypothetical protein